MDTVFDWDNQKSFGGEQYTVAYYGMDMIGLVIFVGRDDYWLTNKYDGTSRIYVKLYYHAGIYKNLEKVLVFVDSPENRATLETVYNRLMFASGKLSFQKPKSYNKFLDKLLRV